MEKELHSRMYGLMLRSLTPERYLITCQIFDNQGRRAKIWRDVAFSNRLVKLEVPM